MSLRTIRHQLTDFDIIQLFNYSIIQLFSKLITI